MAKQIRYRDKFTSAKTVYAEINSSDQAAMIHNLTRAFYELVERSNYDELARNCLNTQDPCFRKHITSGDNATNNSMGSFLAGLLKQHYNNPDRDISTKMLEGITLATQIFDHLKIECPVYEFQKDSSKRVETTPFGRFFQ